MNCSKLATLSIQFTGICGNLYKLYEAIGSHCAIWYTCDDDPHNAADGTTTCSNRVYYGYLKYNVKFIPTASPKTNLYDTGLLGNYTEYATTSLLLRDHHNSNLLFGNPLATLIQ